MVDAYRASVRGKAAVPAITVGEGKDLGKLDFDHPDKPVASCLLAEAVGTNDLDFLGGILVQIANVASKGQTVDAGAVNFMLSMVKGVGPRYQIEATLEAQMAAVHNAAMTFARRLNDVENIPQQDSADRAFNKLARSFTAQVEALKRYRSVGDQTVQVEHVTVNEGGQSIVGNVATGGGARHKRPRQPHERDVSISEKPSLHGHVEADPAALSGPGRHRVGRLPLPWCARRRPDREAQRHIPTRQQHERCRKAAKPQL